ncbi:competence/damage-inducible protein A [Bacillus marinisedimentorum]|uniref:competence/damage-inducible protein A n=1 Tax=Bacillus marinisedimentorum TaxID=1821260 RepID=UPI0007E1F6C7|nr:competence/damage-inducible protein A [Bacillus marinisedimentorum]
MNAEIIAVGSELLLGQICNTNGQFLSRRLAEMGINVFYHTVAGDNPERLRPVISRAAERSDTIILTGGLGPTKDDLTKNVIAELIGMKLTLDTVALGRIKEYYNKTGKTMTPNNEKQALVFEKCTVFPNDHGMAPGMAAETDGKLYLLLPGPPRELNPMFDRYAAPFLYKKLEKSESIESKVLRFFGIGESSLETEIEDLIDSQSNPTIAPLAADGEVTLRLTAKHASPDEARRLIGLLKADILKRVGAHYYGEDETSLAQVAFLLLQEKKLTVSAAESLTGGLFTGALTDYPGASKVVSGSIVAYNNALKEQLLDVPAGVLKSDGAVSEACAASMAENVRLKMGSDIGISFTGNAGPSGSEGKPAGLAYVGIARSGRPALVHELKLAGTREMVRSRTVKHGLFELIQELKKL